MNVKCFVRKNVLLWKFMMKIKNIKNIYHNDIN